MSHRPLSWPSPWKGRDRGGRFVQQRLDETDKMLSNSDSADPIFRIDDDEGTAWFSLGDAWSWLFPLLGFAVFESFANPGISVAVACLKFGYADFRTAWWLRSDRLPGRGKVHAPLYCARGCFVSALCSIAGAILIGLFERAIIKNNPFGVFESLFLSTLLVAVLGFFVGTVAAGVGYARMLESRSLVWMDSTIHQARREKRWISVCHGHRNHFLRFCVGTMTLCSIWLFGAAVMGVTVFNDPQQANKPLWARVLPCLFVFLIAGSPAAAVLAAGWKAMRHAAPNAEMVWAAH